MIFSTPGCYFLNW